MIHVLDASAMVAYLSGEPGAKIVDTLLNDPDALCYAHSINLCEVFYDAVQRTDIHHARQTIRDLRSAGVIERQDMSRRFWQRVGEYKSRGRISLADCLCVSLPGEVVTADHSEFDSLVPIASIRFIR